MAKRGTVEILARGVCVMEGALLLCHSKGADNRYLPGGHVEFRERAAVALAREIDEELGRQARVGRFLGCVEHTFLQKGEPHAEINLLFEMRVAGLTPEMPPPAREAWIDFCWWPLARLNRSRLEPAVLRRMLPRWLAAPAGAGLATTPRGWRP